MTLHDTFEGRPTDEAREALNDELLLERASQVYLWALPLINTMGMKVGAEEKFGAGSNVLTIWKKRLDARTLITTPNSDLLYAMSFVDLGREGPLVLDAPPTLQSILLDCWQRPIQGPTIRGKSYRGDIGFFGPDEGRGGRFLLLPPGYEGAVPDDCFVYRSETNNVFIFLRAFYEDPRDLAPAVALLERTRIYPLGDERAAKPMVFPDASGVPVDMLPRNDARAFDHLKRLVDSEPLSLGGADWMGMLAALGIERDRPFAPDARTRGILDRAAATAYQMSRVLATDVELDGISYRLYPDRHWLNPTASGTSFDLTWRRLNAGPRLLDARINFFTNAYSMSPGMVSKVPGLGANYMSANVDSNGAWLTGRKTYALHLPANIPAKNFWSITVYDAANSSGLDNGQPFPSKGTHDNLAPNPDGSITLYFGPAAPEGKEANWIATVPGQGFFAILRLYGPTEASFDKSWRPGDFEELH